MNCNRYLGNMIQKGLFLFMATVICFILNSEYSFASTIKIEGESCTNANFSPKITARSSASGGAILSLLTTAAPPSQGYTATFQVDVATAGQYQLEIATTPYWTSWSSPFEYSVNGGQYTDVTFSNSEFFASIDSQLNRYILDSVMLTQGINTISFKVIQKRFSDSLYYVFYLDYFTLSPINLKLSSIVGTKPMNVFSNDDVLEFYINMNGVVSSNTSLNWAITDYYNQQISSGTCQIRSGQKSAGIYVSPLQKGHYTITASIPGNSITEFFAVVTPYSQRPLISDSPFALDTAASWCVPKHIINDFASVIELMGVKWIRDRLSWSGVEHTNNSFQYSHYDDYINAISGKGLNIIDTVVNAPPWAVAGTNKLPSDLLEAYDFAKNTGNHYGQSIKMWEIWNEPEDLSTSSDESADQFAAFMKATAIGFRDVTGYQPHIAMGGLVKYRHPYITYQENLLENQVFSFVDIHNFHNHQFFDSGAPHDSFLSQYSISQIDLKNSYDSGAELPTWTTEAGLAIPSMSPAELTNAQQVAQARFMTTSAAMNIANGVDKHFWFIGVPLQEGTNFWGSLSRKWTPYASYVAQTVMTEVLGEAKYKGIVANLPGGAKGYVFKDGGYSVLMLWSNTNQSISLDLQKSSAIKTDLMGRSLTVSSSGGIFNLNIGPDPIYLKVEGDIPSNIINIAEIPETSLTIKTLTSAQRVVLSQAYPDYARINSKVRGAYVLRPNQANTISVNVYNFNPTVMTGSISGVLPPESGYIVSGSQNVTVNPYQKVTLSFTITTTDTVDASQLYKMIFVGSFNGEQTTVSTANIKCERREETFPHIQSLIYEDFDTDSSWSKNVGSWSIDQGKLLQSNTSIASYATYKKAMVGDGTVSTQIKIQPDSSADNWSGIVVRKSNADDGIFTSGYLIFLRPGGILGVQKGGYGSISPQISTGISILSEAKLTVVMNGDKIDVYVNDVHFYTFHDSEYSEGYVSLVTRLNSTYFGDFEIKNPFVRDNFTNDDLWIKCDGEWQATSGVFYQSSVVSNVECNASLPMQFEIGSVEVDVKFEDDLSNNYAGIVLCQEELEDDSTTSGYMVYMKSNGYVGVKKEGILVGDEVDSGTNPLSQYVNLRAVLSEWSLYIYVNGNLKVDIHLDTSEHIGYIGLATYNSRVYFDDFIVHGIIFRDNFSSGSDKWQVNSGNWTVENGVFSQNTDTGSAHTVASMITAGDFEIKANLKMISNTSSDNWAGYVVRKENAGDGIWTSGYLIYIRSSGYVGLYKGGTGLLTPHVNSNVNPMEDFIELKTVFSGSTIRVYVDNNLILTAEDDKYEFGYVGLATLRSHVHFDNISVVQNVFGSDDWQYPLAMEYIEFRNQTGDMYSLDQGFKGIVTGDSIIRNNISSPVPVTYVMALYRNNKVQNVSLETDVIPAKQRRSISGEITVSDNIEDNDFIKIYLMDSLISLRPLSRCKIFDNTGVKG